MLALLVLWSWDLLSGTNQDHIGSSPAEERKALFSHFCCAGFALRRATIVPLSLCHNGVQVQQDGDLHTCRAVASRGLLKYMIETLIDIF